MDLAATETTIVQQQPKKGSNHLILLLLVCLIALVAIAILIMGLSSLLYLGVFNVGERVPEQCNFPEILCTSAIIAPNTISLSLQNVMEDEIRICSIVCDNTLNQNTVPIGGSNGECTNTLATMRAGESKSLVVIGSCKDSTGTVGTGSRYVGKIFITYLKADDTGNPRVFQGDLVAIVK